MNDNFLIFFGFVVGVALGLVAAFANRFGMDATAVFAFGGALIGAAVTAFAAILVAKHQERTRRNNAKEDRNRRQLGARAILAYDLSQVCEYARNSAIAAKRGAELNELPGRHDEVPCPELDPEVLLRFQRLVELLDGDDANQVVDLMLCHQIQQARLSGTLESLNYPARREPPGLLLSKSDFFFTVSLTVELHLRAETMFPFARQDEQFIARPPFTEDAAHNVLRILGVDDWLDEPEVNSIKTQLTNLPPLGPWRHD